MEDLASLKSLHFLPIKTKSLEIRIQQTNNPIILESTFCNIPNQVNLSHMQYSKSAINVF